MTTMHKILGCAAIVGALLTASPVVADDTERLSISSSGVQGDSASLNGAVSVDGRFVAFASAATNLVTGDTNGRHDIFVHDRQTGSTELVSVSSSGGQGDGNSFQPAISWDGRFIAFYSGASNLVAGDTNGHIDIFVHDRKRHTTARVSVDSSGVQSNGVSHDPSISVDGRFVAFASAATNLVAGDANGRHDIFVHDRQTGSTELVTYDRFGAYSSGGSFLPSISRNGRLVAFQSFSSDLIAGDTNGHTDIFVHDRKRHTTARVSVDSSGVQSNGVSHESSISVDGRFVAFASAATNLVTGDTNGRHDIFVHDRQTGTTERVSVAKAGSQGNGDSHKPAISGDGRFVAFYSLASNLAGSDTNATYDVFVHDRQTGTTERISINSAGDQGNNSSVLGSSQAISADGIVVGFSCFGSNLVPSDTNRRYDIFVRAPSLNDALVTDDSELLAVDEDNSTTLDAGGSSDDESDALTLGASGIDLSAMKGLAFAQQAPAPPSITPATDQTSPIPQLSHDEWAAVGYQGSQNRFLVASQDETVGFVKVTLLGTDGSAIGAPQTISVQRGHFPVVEKAVADPPVVAWVGADDVRLRILNPNGSPNGPEVVVDASAQDGIPSFSLPSLSRFVHNGSNYLLTWTKDGPTSQVFGRILDVSNPLSPSPFATAAFPISPMGTTAFASFASAAFDYTQSLYFVVYATIAPTRGVFGQLVRNDGTLVGSPFLVAATGSESVQHAQVAFSPEATTGRFLVVWQQFFLGPTARSSVVAQRVNLATPMGGMPTLSLDGGTIAIDGGSSGMFNEEPDVVYSLALGQYLVAWDAKGATAPHAVRGRLVNFDGTMPRNPFTISVSPITDVHGGNPRVAWSEPFVANIVPTPNRFEFIALWRGSPTTPNPGDARFRFVDQHLDTDGDALLDDWETTGADLNNDGRITAVDDISLVMLEPMNPPSVQRKDIYLEIDWMDCAVGGCAAGDTHSHRLRDLNGNTVPDIVERMVAAFGRNHAPASVRNPDGSNGITLHVDYGQLGGANALRDDQVNIVPANVKVNNLDRLRRRIFHYSVSTHACCGGADLPGQFFWAGRGGSEMNPNDTIAIPANTFMHELGHTLALRHGGVDDINFKPNFLSVMNYAFAAGVPVVGGALPLLDFSNQILPQLNESALNEAAGLGIALGNQATIFSCPTGTRSTQPVAGGIDWNCNMRIDAMNVAVDLNGDSGQGVLTSFDDWSNLFYNFRVIGNFSSAAFVEPAPDNPNFIPPPEPLPSPEEIHQSLARPVIEIRVVDIPPFAKPGFPVVFATRLENGGLGLAQNVKLITQLGDQVHRHRIGALPPGDRTRRIDVFVVPRDIRGKSVKFSAAIHLEDALNAPLPSVMRSHDVPVLRSK